MEKRDIIAGRGFYYIPAPFVTLKVTVESEYHHDKMKKALLNLEEAYPIINDVVRKDGDNMWFEDIGVHVRIVAYVGFESMKWEDAMKHIIQNPIDLTKKPGVIIGIVAKEERFHLLVVCHQMYADGISVKQLADDLLYMYRMQKKIESHDILTLREEMLPHDCQVEEEFRNKLNKVNQLWEKNKIEYSWDTFTQVSDLHNEAIGYRVACGKLKGSDYRKLRGKCKELGITVQAAVITAVAGSLQKLKNIHSMVALNARPLLGLEEDKGMINYASSVGFDIQYEQRIDFWYNAQIVNQQLKKAKNDRGKQLEVLCSLLLLQAEVFGLPYYAEYGMYQDKEAMIVLKDILGVNTAEETFEVSDIGNITFDAANEEFMVRDCYFVPSLPLACDYTIGVVSFDNALTLTLGYKSNMQNEEQMERIIANIKEKLLDF